MIPRALDRHGLAFVSYSSFCPQYAKRYDGVFSTLTPFSFFMPPSVLAVQAEAFVYGIADARVGLTARAVATARPDIPRGTVVSTTLAPGTVMDEGAPYGLNYRADLDRERITVSIASRPTAPESWGVAVRQRASHTGNAARITAALAPDGCESSARLVEHNAALILWEYHGRRLSQSRRFEEGARDTTRRPSR